MMVARISEWQPNLANNCELRPVNRIYHQGETASRLSSCFSERWETALDGNGRASPEPTIDTDWALLRSFIERSFNS